MDAMDDATDSDAPIDTFIASAEPFARPILDHLRALVHRTVPGVEETIKWGMPFFTLSGKNVCGMGAFKAHCSFIIEGAGSRGGEGMGHFGKIARLGDLPAEPVIADLLRERVEAINSGKKKPPVPRKVKPPIAVPQDFTDALSEAALRFFGQLAPGQRREYLEWITEARRPETRAKRIAQAAEWLGEGKKRNWKYENC